MDRFGKYDSEPELSRFHNYPLRKKLPERAVWTDSLKKKIPESFSDRVDKRLPLKLEDSDKEVRGLEVSFD